MGVTSQQSPSSQRQPPSSSSSSIMDISKEVFGAFAFYAAIVTVKMLLMSLATARQRFRKLVFISEEDIAGNAQAKVSNSDPDVERVRRAHLNDIENILPFLALGLLYCFTQPAYSTALNVF